MGEAEARGHRQRQRHRERWRGADRDTGRDRHRDRHSGRGSLRQSGAAGARHKVLKDDEDGRDRGTWAQRETKARRETEGRRQRQSTHADRHKQRQRGNRALIIF